MFTRPRREVGFTLIELMIVVAVIAILASVVVPSFMSSSRKGKARAEVGAMFAELTNKEQAYKLDNPSYLAAGVCPASPSSTSQDMWPCIQSGQPWNALNVNLPDRYMYCTYEIDTGTSSQTPAPPTGFTMAAPATAWFYIVATCNMTGSSTNSTYFTSSVDSTIQAQNEGN